VGRSKKDGEDDRLAIRLLNHENISKSLRLRLQRIREGAHFVEQEDLIKKPNKVKYP